METVITIAPILLSAIVATLICFWRREKCSYRIHNEKLQVKEEKKDWEDLDKHMEQEHPEEYRKR